MKLPLLYSRRSDGGIQTWQIEVVDNKYRSISGTQDGAKVASKWTVCQGKNVGRANETTPVQQAEAEARAAWQKKVNEGYTEDPMSVDNKRFFEPMLAKKYADYVDELVFPVYCQPKLDGMRCIAKANGLWSREGKPIKSAPHIFVALQPLFKTYPDLVLDGELYADKFKDDFNAIISLAKKQKPTAADLAASASHLQYWVYDCIPPTGNTTFDERLRWLERLNSEVHTQSCVRVVETHKVMTRTELDEHYERWLEAGYEGQIIRLNALYEHKRTKALLKRKEFQDDEFEILDILEGVGNRAGVAAKVVHRAPNGKTCESGIIGSIDYCRRLLQDRDRIIGKMGTIRYFNVTPAGKLRFSKLKAIRDYE